jgi:hydrogenase/urease accessory protein HupE
MPRFLTALFVLASVFCCTNASAHQTGKSLYVAHVQPAEKVVDTVTTFPAIDLVDHLGRDDGDEVVSVDEWRGNLAEIEAYLASAISVTTNGNSCATDEASAKLSPDGSAVYVHRFRCESFGPAVVLRNEAMTEMATGYTHFGRIQVGDGDEQTTAFNRAFPTYEVAIAAANAADADAPEPAPSGSLLDLIMRFVWQGVIHIILGLDHVLFVFALVLISRDLRRLLGVITAFTVSHSVTLAMATLGVVTLPATIVEPIIAASILYVAFEAWFREHEPRYIYATTFLLGLVHGFGFSYVLADVGLPQDAIVPALFAFNVGVELGQVGLILLLWPLRRWALDQDWERTAVRVCAVALGAVATFWLVERVYGALA